MGKSNISCLRERNCSADELLISMQLPLRGVFRDGLVKTITRRLINNK